MCSFYKHPAFFSQSCSNSDPHARKVRCDYQVANGTSELLAEFERSGEEQILAPGGGFYAFVEDFRGGNARIERLDAMSFSQDQLNNCISMKCYEIFPNDLAWLNDHLIPTVLPV